ncbi:hypothetical protein CYY_005961 [Polysphondylium violaceum]|uniref:Regulator of chromosome condensation domain-containing protein n=1 Tax=Polysphondylium violaceum TaxID=133409 RepID=A0A8J4UYG4_9MYCE|nr:hypothetical protein CYY_005961 [Polysphondylium violaceum]
MSVFTFGLGVNGALGLGDLESNERPQKVNFFSEINKRVKKVACGSYHTVFVTDDDELYISGLARDPKQGTTLFLGLDNSSNNNNGRLESSKSNSSSQLRDKIPSSERIPHTLSTRNLLENAPDSPIGSRNSGNLRKDHDDSKEEEHVDENETNITFQSSCSPLTASQFEVVPPTLCEPPKSTPVKIPTAFLDHSPSSIIKLVSLGNYHIVLLTEGGNVWSWGSNSNGQLGYPLEASQCNTPRMVELKCVKTIATGVKHTAAVTEWGELYMWGINSSGELGLGDTADRKVPTRVNKLKNEAVSIIACSSTHSACYTESGKMYLWGQISEEAGKIQTIPTNLPIHSYLDRELEGGSSYGGGGKIKQIVCGEWLVAVLTQMGEVFMWKVGGKPTPLRHVLDTHSVRSIAMGNFHLICVTDSGEVITCGRNRSGQLGRDVGSEGGGSIPGIVKELSFEGKGLNQDEFVLSIHAGEYHSVALVENTPKTKLALSLVRMQRNYLRQLNILFNVYYKNLMAFASPYDPALLQVISGAVSLPTKNPSSLTSSSSSSSLSDLAGSNLATSPSKGDGHVPISASSSTSSPGLLGGTNGTLKNRSYSILTIRNIFGISAPTRDMLNEDYVVTEDDIKEIFSDIESLVKLTENFLARLDSRMEYWDAERKFLGDLFLEENILGGYRVYIPFSDAYNTSCMTLFNTKRKSEKFTNIIKECEKKSKIFGIKLDHEFVKDQDLKGLLLAPLQNIPRIYIMLKELSIKTLPNHKDLDLLTQASVKFQVLLERMNQNFQFVDAVEILNCSSNEYGNPQIMGGSLDQLVDKLTHHNISDPYFRDVFLLTFRAFTNPLQLFDLLLPIFKRDPRNTRVINVITSWVVHHYYDFESDYLCDQSDISHQPSQLRFKLEQFIDTSVVENQQITQIKLQYLAQKKRFAASLANKTPSTATTDTAVSSPPTPTPATTPTANFSILDYQPIEVAHVLTTLCHQSFAAIDKREFLQQRWTKNKAPNIQALTEQFNRFSQVCITEILKTKNSKHRSTVIAHFISIAYSCFELNNIAGVATIIYGLNSAPISRLKKSWSKLTKESTQAFEYLDKIVTPLKNYISLRHLMTTIQPPCVPFLGIHLKDLTFIEEGNPSIIGGLINFYKQRKIYEVIFQISQYQQLAYSNLSKNPAILDFYLHSNVLDDKQAQKISSESE